MSLLLSPAYWLSFEARELMPMAKLALVALFGLVTVVGAIGRSVSKRNTGDIYKSEGGRRVAALGLWMGPLGLLLVWFTHELAYFFGARFWFLIWLLVFLVWKISILKFLVREAPRKAQAHSEKARIDKWIPKG